MATKAQRKWAAKNGIPMSEADKISPERAFEYEKWCQSDECKVEEYLISRSIYHMEQIQKEYMWVQR